MSNKNSKNSKNWLILLILGSLVYRLFGFLFKKNNREDIKINFVDFWKKEKKEIKKLKKGQEGVVEYCADSYNIFKDYFIPSECNDFKPRILRTSYLMAIIVFVVVIKLAVTGYLFFIYPNQARMEEQMTNEILELTNNDRAINNIPALKLNSALSLAALAKANDMLAKGYFAHYSPPDNKKPWDWISRSDYPYLIVGENLGMNFTSAKSVQDALMQSPSHKKNILNPNYKDVGLAIVTGDFNGSKTNILVETFATQKGTQLAVAKSDIAKTNATTPVKPTVQEKVAVAGNAEKVTPSAPVVKPKVIIKAPVVNNATSAPIAPVVPIASSVPAIAKDTVIATKPSEPLQYGTQYNETEALESIIPEEEIVPNEELADNRLNQVFYVNSTSDAKTNFANNLIALSRNILIAVLLFLILALIVNIVVKFRVQHRPIIVQTLAVILLIVGLLSVQFNILEKITAQIILI